MADGAGEGSGKKEQPNHVKVVDSYTRPSGGEAPPEALWRGRLRRSGQTNPAEGAPPPPRAHIDVPDGRPTIVISEPGIDEEIAALAAAEAARLAREEELARQAEAEARARQAQEEAAARQAEEEELVRQAKEEALALAAEEDSDAATVPEEVSGAGPPDHVVVIDDLDGDDAGLDAGDTPSTVGAARGGSRGPRRARRGRRVAAAAAGLVVVGGGAAAAALTLLPGRLGARTRSAEPPVTSPPSTAAQPKPPAASSTTTTTVAGPLPPSSTAPGGALWAAPAGAYSVTLKAHGACWVEVTAGPGGAVLAEGTLAAGDSRTLTRPGPLWIRLGAAAEVTVALEGRPLAVPAGVGDNPYNITIQPPG